jgi:mono/diheme cytochrome c family protein
MSVRKILIAGIAFAALTGILAACGGSSAPAATATAAPAATEAATATEAVTETEATTTTESAQSETVEIARPSNGNLTPGPAITENIVGDPKAGAQVFVDNCKKCHGEEGAVGIDNPGSTDGTVPNLNPIDETLVSSDPKVFATNIDLFIEHGSTPEGDSPKQVMDAWGDTGKLTKQQIADVIAYIISLNKANN